ncbi:hypothetical protein P153DRAFT_303987 [Dothidotthia symphoricarpi CBS 119687]|uniref:Uncharacterized protein n=1 Tax=Dothidotthia symphoricarpi CBS 119687 TaxID=1392245 RepID=A0A6A5ZV39_9PLEO|nr:uncharacterized protein P153DRAFT_303987 [Dothidotthia symphoricarpi CBS 119687]KAF2123369.1 hypothetical protein P153DRAFT_303987 [Dothidotthia symphoricarpi CBS 119687]
MVPTSEVPFPHLPVELRELIYLFAFLPEPHTPGTYQKTFSAADSIYNRGPLLPCFLPKFCHVNEATRVEVGLWYIRSIEIGILYPANCSYFTRFLNTFPNQQGFEAVRRLEFQLFGRYRVRVDEVNPYIELMKCCPGLMEARIKFRISDFCKPQLCSSVENPCNSSILSIQTLVETYRMTDLFDLNRLTKLTIEIWLRKRTKPETQIVSSHYVLQIDQLKDWLKFRFLEQGRRVNVVVESVRTAGVRLNM